MSNNCIYEKSLKLDEVEDLTEFLAEQLNLGGVLFLNGDLGTGKTTLIKDLVKKLGSQDEVSSPSYSIINHYESEDFTIFHMDLYRLDALSEYDSLWLDEYVDSGGVCIIEWADKLGHQFNEPFLRVTIDWDMLEDARTFTFEGLDAHYSELVRRLEDTFKC